MFFLGDVYCICFLEMLQRGYVLGLFEHPSPSYFWKGRNLGTVWWSLYRNSIQVTLDPQLSLRGHIFILYIYVYISAIFNRWLGPWFCNPFAWQLFSVGRLSWIWWQIRMKPMNQQMCLAHQWGTRHVARRFLCSRSHSWLADRGPTVQSAWMESANWGWPNGESHFSAWSASDRGTSNHCEDQTSRSALKQLVQTSYALTSFGKSELELQVSVQRDERLKIIVFRLTALAVEHAVARYDRSSQCFLYLQRPESALQALEQHCIRAGLTTCSGASTSDQKQGVKRTHAITDDRRLEALGKSGNIGRHHCCHLCVWSSRAPGLCFAVMHHACWRTPISHGGRLLF